MNALRDEPRNPAAKAVIFIATMGVLIVVAFIVSMNTGSFSMSPLDVIRTLFGQGTAQMNLALFDFRLPRIVLSLLVGAGLAVSGCLLQGVVRNPIADPGILGINAGAGVAVVLFVTFFPNKTVAPVWLLPCLALVGSSLAALILILISFEKNRGLSPTRLVLSGIALAAGLSALMIVLMIQLDSDNYQFVATFLAGSIWGTDWRFVLSLVPWLLLILPYVFLKARTLDLLNLGDSLASGLGVPVRRARLIFLASAVGLAASCVAVSGAIGFVGLIGPHIARRIVGPKHAILLPASALIGALLVLVADTISRVTYVPAGLIVAMIGAPYFLYLLAKLKG
ncbi:FecCD family ABC transporter permease [Paenibacillaceae bacterium WGS1546]|uniref:FecCD family ABC transporter permease n=1 Tax=Cohnella sp. WGS1546 TaxID=3366810 RepID=UPI00372D58A5